MTYHPPSVSQYQLYCDKIVRPMLETIYGLVDHVLSNNFLKETTVNLCKMATQKYTKQKLMKVETIAECSPWSILQYL